MKTSMNRLLFCLTFSFLILSTGCGGSSSTSSTPPPPASSNGPTWKAGVFENESTFINQCQSPRSGTDFNGNTFPDMQGSTLEENHWLRSWSNNTYLWYQELPDIDPAQESVATEYFKLLKTSQTTDSGNPKDSFHFFWDTEDYIQFIHSGVSVSYGIDWELASTTVPRALYIRYIESGSPADATALDLNRGVKVIKIDGVDVETENTQAGIDILNAGIYPSSVGESHTFTVRDVGSNQDREVTIQATDVTFDPVPMVNTFTTTSGTVGYMLFTNHNFVSEDKLFDAMTLFSNNDVTDLILDLRYNGGGLLYISSQLSYMIAGASATSGKTFEELRFNDKHTQTNPITGNSLSPTPFYSSISQYSDNYSQGTPLPQLNLNRVFILSTAGTCSASEAIINGLRGIDVEVILIGDTTCGKPYGFYPADNCGTTFFTIQFDGINQKGSGGYSDGFSPMNTAGSVGELVTGCSVVDDLSIGLGVEQDPLVAAALDYRLSSTCPALVAQVKTSNQQSSFLNESGANNDSALTLRRMFDQKIYVEPYEKN